MQFARKQDQYKSCTAEARRIARLAERYGAFVDGWPDSGWSGSSYFTVGLEDERASVRVSRHQPNYGRTGDRNIMVYVSGDWLRDAERFCADFEAYFTCERPKAVQTYLRGLRSRRETEELKRRELQAKREQRDAEIAAERQQERQAELRDRCARHKVTEEDIKLAYGNAATNDPCSIHSQIRAWFKGFTLEEALNIGTKS